MIDIPDELLDDQVDVRIESPSDGEPSPHYPKFQLSKFLDAKRDYQVVVRTNSFKELEESLRELAPLAKGIQSKAQQAPAVPTHNSDGSPRTQTRECTVHKTTMQSAVSKRTGKPYYFHKGQNGEMCFGKGYMDKVS